MLSLTGKQWIFSEPVERYYLDLVQKFGLSFQVARILAARVNKEEISSFLSPSLRDHLPDPHFLPDMQKAVCRVVQAIQQREKICVWGDYDVDGATSAALLINFFSGLGLDKYIQYHIPDRFKDGYGLNKKGLSELKESGVNSVIAVDCGTTAFESLTHAASIGLDVIVIDHHAAESLLPSCVALVNPKRLDAGPEAQIFENLAAVGLTFLFVIACHRELRTLGFYDNKNEPDLRQYLDLVALGTVCDVMPLRGLNRVFVAQGLKIMGYRKNVGLKHLQDISGLSEPPRAYHLGFLLGPRINAGGRVGESDLGVRLLTTKSPCEAEKLACHLNQLNQMRQTIEENVQKQAEKAAHQQLKAGAQAVVIHGEDWHEGVIGIVAGRLKEQFHVPVFVINLSHENQLGKGSARSVPGFDLGAFIHTAVHKGLLASGGGHAMAGGFSLTLRQLKNFQEYVYEASQNFFKNVEKTPVLSIESWVTFQSLTVTSLQELKILEPYGIGNPQPRFAFADIRLVQAVPMGNGHAKLKLAQLEGTMCEAIAFRCAEKPIGDFLFSNPAKLFDIVGTIGLNTWRNKETPQIILEDIRLQV